MYRTLFFFRAGVATFDILSPRGEMQGVGWSWVMLMSQASTMMLTRGDMILHGAMAGRLF
jgi:hypothetical protein